VLDEHDRIISLVEDQAADSLSELDINLSGFEHDDRESRL